MKLTLIVIAGCFLFLFRGLRHPGFFALGYIWVSLLYPQAFTEGLYFLVPWNMIFLGLTVLGYVLYGAPLPRVTPVFLAFVAFFIWIGLTTTWAYFPDEALEKWKWASTSVAMGLIFPLFFRDRKRIEQLMIVVFCALLPHVLTGGIKSALGGGGYGSLRTLMFTNFYLGESSTLACIAITLIPVGYYVARHSMAAHIIPFPRIATVGFGVIALTCMIGTSARTGIFALGSFLMIGIRGLRYKVAAVALLGCVAIVLAPVFSEAWISRMRTIETYGEDTSASVRLKVWAWTFNFAKSHPLGGGFDSYKLSASDPDFAQSVGRGRAFHSVYFEIMGEHGFVGLGLYLIVALGSTLGFWRLSRRRDLPPHLEWVRPFSTCMFAAMVPFMVGATFIGVAFQPFGYTFYGIYLSVLTAMKSEQPVAGMVSVAPHPAMNAAMASRTLPVSAPARLRTMTPRG